VSEATENDRYRQGDVAIIEGRVAVYIPNRWEWMDGNWTTIPLEVGHVLFNVYEKAAELMMPESKEL